MKITSAYYDGAVIGVALSVEGTIKTEEDGRIQGLYEIFDGKDGSWRFDVLIKSFTI